MKLRTTAVVFPVAVLLAWLLSLAVSLARAREVTLPIRGYDPRDLLSGHYLRYTVDYGIDLAQVPPGPACVCLSTADGVARGSWVGECAQRDPITCPLFVRGRKDWRGFEAGIERFYFPEILKDELARVPEGATISVKVTSSGTAYVTGMKVRDTSVLDQPQSGS